MIHYSQNTDSLYISATTPKTRIREPQINIRIVENGIRLHNSPTAHLHVHCTRPHTCRRRQSHAQGPLARICVIYACYILIYQVKPPYTQVALASAQVQANRIRRIPAFTRVSFSLSLPLHISFVLRHSRLYNAKGSRYFSLPRSLFLSRIQPCAYNRRSVAH